MKTESVDSQKILHNIKRRIKQISKKTDKSILELCDSLAQEAGFQHWHDFTKNLAHNSQNQKVQKLIEIVNDRSEYKKERDQETEKWMRKMADQSIKVLSYQWNLMAEGDKYKDYPLENITLLLADKNQMSLPEHEGPDFMLAQRLATFYRVNQKRFEPIMTDLLYRELAKLYLENKEHFVREFPMKALPSLSSQNNLNWSITEIYKSLHHVDSRNESEDVLYHLLRSSPNNEDTALNPSRFPFRT